MFRLDIKNSITKKVSNDTFFYLLNEEEPLLGINESELNEIYSQFENGFEITDWEYSTNNLILVTFTPYIEDNWDYDLYRYFTTDCMLQVKKISDSEMAMRWFDTTKGSSEIETVKIKLTERNNPYFITSKGSTIFIKGLKRK